MALLFLFLWFFTIGKPIMEEEEGIEVSFGNDANGGGSEAEAIPMPAVPVTQAPAPTPQEPSKNDLMVQDDEESLALQKQREEERKRKAEEEELIRRQREEEQRIEAERIAREQQLAEERARQAAIEQEKRDKANAMGALFGNNQQGASGSGTTQGNSIQGSQNPVGHGSSGGNSWSLKGRNLKALPKPSTNFKQEGKVVVNIQVNSAGKVISATVGEGTTVSDYQTRQVALEAARRAEFSPSDQKIQIGTITYTFKIN